MSGELLECPLCGKRTKTVSGMVTHIARVHYDKYMDLNGWKCPVCGMRFNDIKSLRMHLAKTPDVKHMAWNYIIANGARTSARRKYYEAFIKWIEEERRNYKLPIHVRVMRLEI